MSVVRKRSNCINPRRPVYLRLSTYRPITVQTPVTSSFTVPPPNPIPPLALHQRSSFFYLFFLFSFPSFYLSAHSSCHWAGSIKSSRRSSYLLAITTERSKSCDEGLNTFREEGRVFSWVLTEDRRREGYKRDMLINHTQGETLTFNLVCCYCRLQEAPKESQEFLHRWGKSFKTLNIHQHDSS